MRTAVLVLFLIVVLTVSGTAQTKSATPPTQNSEARQAEQSKEVLRELAQSEFKAKVDIPAVDYIFVEDGKLQETSFRAALKDNPKALKAGTVTKISKVKVMDHGVQVFLASDACALIALSTKTIVTAEMTPKQLADVARKSIAALFEAVVPEKTDSKEPANKTT